MPRHVVLLRGINLVRRNRIAMPELRAALGADGFRDVTTYVQSGNVVLSSRASPERVAKRVNAVIKQRLGLDIVVLVRSAADDRGFGAYGWSAATRAGDVVIRYVGPWWEWRCCGQEDAEPAGGDKQ